MKHLNLSSISDAPAVLLPSGVVFRLSRQCERQLQLGQ